MAKKRRDNPGRYAQLPDFRSAGADGCRQILGHIGNILGSATSREATVTVTPAVPPTVRVLADPGTTVVAGQSVNFFAETSGSFPFRFQWLKDGAPIPGATVQNHAINPVAAPDAGSYTVTVTNGGGIVTSAPTILVVNPAVAPAITRQPADLTVNSRPKSASSSASPARRRSRSAGAATT